jgi:tetratricopeptide (TPR) repeat protein
MAYTYDWMWRFDDAIRAIDMYISIAPEEPNPYDSKGDILTRNGRLEAANRSYAKSLEIKPDFWASLYKFGKNNLYLGNYALADSCFNELAGSEYHLWRVTGLAARAYVPLWQGRFDDAIAILTEGIETVRTAGEENDAPLLHHLMAIAYEEKGDPASALAEHEEAIRINLVQSPENHVYNRHLLVHILAKRGDIDRAERVAGDLKKNLGPVNDTLWYRFALGSIESAKGDLPAATSHFEKAAEDSVIPHTPANFMLASIYMEVGRWEDAVREIRKWFRYDFSPTRPYYGSYTARAHYLLGVAYESMNQPDRAIEHYRIFLDLWKNADPGIVIIDDAKRRLSRLTNSS